MAQDSVVKVILTYFGVTLILFLSAYLFPIEAAIPVVLSILLLIPHLRLAEKLRRQGKTLERNQREK